VVVADVDPAIWAGIIGAVLGAVFTAGGTLLVSIRLDRQRENRRLFRALGVIKAEVKDNRARLGRRLGGTHLTLGDWAQNKADFADLELRNKDLWDRLVDVYSRIYAATRSNRAKPPSVEELGKLERDLLAEQEAVGRDLRSRNPFRRQADRGTA
jgi:hypothetical protein